jgi:DNA-binding XRE family transcriptional regulator
MNSKSELDCGAQLIDRRAAIYELERGKGTLDRLLTGSLPRVAWLGAEIRRRRTSLGISQADLARPFTRAYVSAVETGRCVPSLSALVLLAERLSTTSGDLLDAVNPGLAPMYTHRRATGQTKGATRSS